MGTELTKRQDEVFEFIKSFIKKNGFAPTMAEIGESFDVSRQQAWNVCISLERKGKIRHDFDKNRGIEVL